MKCRPSPAPDDWDREKAYLVAVLLSGEWALEALASEPEPDGLKKALARRLMDHGVEQVVFRNGESAMMAMVPSGESEMRLYGCV